jgi:hypothetical protein
MSSFEVTAILSGQKGVYLPFFGQNQTKLFDKTLMGFFYISEITHFWGIPKQFSPNR